MADLSESPSSKIEPQIGESALLFVKKFTVNGAAKIAEKFAGAELVFSEKKISYPSRYNGATNLYTCTTIPITIGKPTEIQVNGNQDDITVTYRAADNRTQVIHLHAALYPYPHVEINQDKQKFEPKS